MGMFAAVAQQKLPPSKPLAPLPLEVPTPKNNPASKEKIALGKSLFFDPRLSGDNSMSCATCHVPEKGWADGQALSKGDRGKLLALHTPTVLNVGFFGQLFWDGRAKSLEEQALGPIQSADEMNQNLPALVAELNAIPGYTTQFQQVFGTPVTEAGISQALAAFQRSLVAHNSPFDRYLKGDKSALSDAARHGLELFQGEAGCVRCHHGPLLSDEKFYRLGVSFDEAGLAAVTKNKDDTAKFRTPSLRNVAQTGPYMHNGSLKTLENVVEFYYRGVPSRTPDGLKLDIQPLSAQSFSDIADLVSFLESLTGETPVVSPPMLP